MEKHLGNGKACGDWSAQHSCAVGLASLGTTALNTFADVTV
ncbi:hypothetical protein, partial [Klebsiella pneumoniae]